MSNVRMIQRGKEFRFAFEAQPPRTIRRKNFGKDLDRHLALQLGVSRAINLAHSTNAQRRSDFVGTNHRAWSEGHDWRGLYSVKRHVTLAGFSGCEGKPGVHGGKARGCESKPADFSGYVRSPLVWGHQHAVPEITHRPVAYRIIVC